MNDSKEKFSIKQAIEAYETYRRHHSAKGYRIFGRTHDPKTHRNYPFLIKFVEMCNKLDVDPSTYIHFVHFEWNGPKPLFLNQLTSKKAVKIVMDRIEANRTFMQEKARMFWNYVYLYMENRGFSKEKAMDRAKKLCGFSVEPIEDGNEESV